MKLQLQYEAPKTIIEVHPRLNILLAQAVGATEAHIALWPTSDWPDFLASTLRRHTELPADFRIEEREHAVTVTASKASGAPVYAIIMEVSEKSEVLNKRWTVQADPDFPAGTHVNHDYRFITTADCHFSDRVANEGSIICAMRDVDNIRAVTEHIVMLHNAHLSSAYFDETPKLLQLVNDFAEQFAAMRKAWSNLGGSIQPDWFEEECIQEFGALLDAGVANQLMDEACNFTGKKFEEDSFHQKPINVLVAEELTRRGYEASANPVPPEIMVTVTGDISWSIGTVNGTWGLDLTMDDGSSVWHSIDTQLDGKCTEVKAIADALEEAMTSFIAKRQMTNENARITSAR